MRPRKAKRRRNCKEMDFGRLLLLSYWLCTYIYLNIWSCLTLPHQHPTWGERSELILSRKSLANLILLLCLTMKFHSLPNKGNIHTLFFSVFKVLKVLKETKNNLFLDRLFSLTYIVTVKPIFFNCNETTQKHQVLILEKLQLLLCPL